MVAKRMRSGPWSGPWSGTWSGTWSRKLVWIVGLVAAAQLGAGDAAARGRQPSPGRAQGHGFSQGRGHVHSHGRGHDARHHDCRSPATTTLSGTAYTFNTRNPIVGAEIRVDELPGLVAVTDDAGAFALEVPSGADVTPYIVAAGHHTVYAQTFRTTADPIEQVNFQTPTDGVYDLLYLLIQAYVGRPPFADGCVIVSTVSDPRVVGMSFDEFIHFAPHGVAGASVSGFPVMPAPIYFNDAVIPDLAQLTTSGDGGVLWPNVPPGVYQVSASHPELEFASFTATCVQDRVINASPPWGLHGIP